LRAHDDHVSFVTTDDLDHVSALSKGGLAAPTSLLRKTTPLKKKKRRFVRGTIKKG